MEFFSKIIGQDRAIDLLKRSITTGNINHAYLFVGPAGTGKTTVARAFAYTLLAKGDSGAQSFLKDGVHPDLLIIEKPENKTVIGKDQISKDMEPWLALKPFRADRKIVIIKESNLLSLEAANALLKTLEEPPQYTVIILVSDELNLLETILSRCQQVKFLPIADNKIEDFLIKKNIDPDRAYQASRLAQGSISAAIKFGLEQEFYERFNIIRNLVFNIAKGEYIAVFDAAQKMEPNPHLSTNMMEIILRDTYIYQQTGRQELLAIPHNLDMIKTMPRIEPDKIRNALNILNSFKKYYRTNVNSFLINTSVSFEIFHALNG